MTDKLNSKELTTSEIEDNQENIIDDNTSLRNKWFTQNKFKNELTQSQKWWLGFNEETSLGYIEHFKTGLKAIINADSITDEVLKSFFRLILETKHSWYTKQTKMPADLFKNYHLDRLTDQHFPRLKVLYSDFLFKPLFQFPKRLQGIVINLILLNELETKLSDKKWFNQGVVSAQDRIQFDKDRAEMGWIKGFITSFRPEVIKMRYRLFKGTFQRTWINWMILLVLAAIENQSYTNILTQTYFRYHVLQPNMLRKIVEEQRIINFKEIEKNKGIYTTEEMTDFESMVEYIKDIC